MAFRVFRDKRARASTMGIYVAQWFDTIPELALSARTRGISLLEAGRASLWRTPTSGQEAKDKPEVWARLFAFSTSAHHAPGHGARPHRVGILGCSEPRRKEALPQRPEELIHLLSEKSVPREAASGQLRAPTSTAFEAVPGVQRQRQSLRRRRACQRVRNSSILTQLKAICRVQAGDGEEGENLHKQKPQDGRGKSAGALAAPERLRMGPLVPSHMAVSSRAFFFLPLSF